MVIRETIYATLWALGSGAARFASANRRLRHWADVAPAEQPALFMREKGGIAAIKRLGAPIVWTLHAEFYVYAHSSDPYLAPGTILNPLIDALEAEAGWRWIGWGHDQICLARPRGARGGTRGCFVTTNPLRTSRTPRAGRASPAPTRSRNPRNAG